MTFYIENKSLGFVKKAYEAVTANTKKTVFKAVVINRKWRFDSSAYSFLTKKKKIYDIEYVIFNTRFLKSALKLLNKRSKSIALTVVVNKPLTKREKSILSNNCRKEIKIIDFTNNASNLEFYKHSKYILYRTNDEDTILKTDVMHISKFYEPQYQCKFSSCMGNNLYVDKAGNVYFCPEHRDKSFVGSIYDKTNYFKNENMLNILRSTIEKRNKCKGECENFQLCNGGCPLENSCLNFPTLLENGERELDEIINSNSDLSKLNYAVGRIIIKDIAYGEN